MRRREPLEEIIVLRGLAIQNASTNRQLTGSGTGARLEYKDIDSSFLEMVRTKVTNELVELERDQKKRNYLHPVGWVRDCS